MIKRLALAVLLSAGLSAPALAQTVGYAEAIDILAKACGQDIQRHCASARLANNGITRCLAQNDVPPQCGNALAQVRNSLRARQEAQASAERVCDRDIQRLCNMVQRGRGHVLRCLLKAEPSVSQRCNQAITNAGWR